jgi:hypothetical protein
VIAGSATLRVGVAGRFLDRRAFRALASTVIQVDELFGRAGVADNVELANRLLPRNFKCCSGGPEGFPFGGIFCPPTAAREVFQRLGVFDKYVHERSYYQIRRDCKHANGQIRDFNSPGEAVKGVEDGEDGKIIVDIAARQISAGRCIPHRANHLLRAENLRSTPGAALPETKDQALPQ